MRSVLFALQVLPGENPGPSAPGTFDKIGAAFGSALARHDGPIVFIPAALIGVIALVAVVRWLRRDIGRDRQEQEVTVVRHEAAMAAAREAEAVREHRRQWLRVVATLRLRLHRTVKNSRVVFEDFETADISAGGVTFFSPAPPAAGAHVRFDVYLGDDRPMALQGGVLSVEPAVAEDGPPLVIVKFGPISQKERDQLASWVAREDTRQVMEARRGRLCKRCQQPLADEQAEMHSTCASVRPKPA